MSYGLDLKVWGEYACFTRPEFKVERVSYPVMTPAAARGVLEAIYWKPQIRYRIQRIGILSLGTQFSLLRNEITSRQNKDAKGIDFAIQLLRDPQKKKVHNSKTKVETADQAARRHFAVAEDDRAQRTSLVLRDVAYRICASIELRDGETNIAKHLDCFRRRAEGGECFHRPYLGCREFAADFEPADKNGQQPSPGLDLPIGTMLFDTAYVEDNNWHERHTEDRLEFWKHDGEDARIAKGRARRLFFDAAVRQGWLEVPEELYRQMAILEDTNGVS